ncbi:MAG TPA: hypothetical protein ENJ06_03770 [Phycisphaeraceae bacterium]|nr:hypothetical protein [Phycisphaeraceae bacterium]
MSVERAKQLLDALAKIEQWRSKPAAMRKRRFTRFGVRSTAILNEAVACSRGSTSNATTVQLRDVSRGGAGFLHDTPMRVDSAYRLTLAQDDLVIQTIPLFIRYCQQVEDSAYLIGGEFGAEASMLMSLGVSPRDISAFDVPEDSLNCNVSGEFEDPSDLDEDQTNAA